MSGLLEILNKCKVQIWTHFLQKVYFWELRGRLCAPSCKSSLKRQRKTKQYSIHQDLYYNTGKKRYVSFSPEAGSQLALDLDTQTAPSS